MNIVDEDFQLTLSQDQVLVIHQSLNEVCNGFRAVNFEEKIGNEQFARSEMQKLGAIFDEIKSHERIAPTSLNVTAKQLILYRNAVRETCHEIDEWEFATRIGGIEKSVAEDLLLQLENATT